MASLIHFLNHSQSMKKEILKLCNEAELKRKHEYNAAVKIQSWIRGLQTRHYLRHLHEKSIIIQKHWRGFMARNYFRIYVRNLHFMMRINFYHAMASRIQRIWRGFHARKYKHNFYARKRYFNALEVKNQIVRYELEAWKEHNDAMTAKQAAEEGERELMEEARREHHLRSTKQNPGVYNSPFDATKHDRERRLIMARPRRGDPPVPRKVRDQNQGCVDDTEPPQLFLHAPITLPPLDERKLQGPFRSRQVVYNQRYRPLNPTVLVSNPYESLKEARKALKAAENAAIVVEERWRPSFPYDHPYEKTMFGAERYKGGPRKINRKQFREENRNKWVGDESFRNIVPPVPIFERINDTYYPGEIKY